MDKSTLIHNVLVGRASEQERTELKEWISSDPLNAEEFEDMKILYSDSWDNDPDHHDEQFEEGLRKLQEAIRTLNQKQKRKFLFKTMSASLIISACIFILITGLFRRDNLDFQKNVRGSELLLSDNLRFKEATLESIFTILEDKYHLAFAVNTKDLLACKFTGTFHRGITIEEMIGTLAQAGNFEYTFVENNKMQISGKGC